VSNFEYSTEDIAEVEDEQVQELEAGCNLVSHLRESILLGGVCID
jgi:hypothetical protein